MSITYIDFVTLHSEQTPARFLMDDGSVEVLLQVGLEPVDLAGDAGGVLAVDAGEAEVPLLEPYGLDEPLDAYVTQGIRSC